MFGALGRARESVARASSSTPISAPVAGPIPIVARAVFGEAFAVSDIVLASPEDLLPLYPDESDEQLMARIPCNEAVLKLPSPGEHRAV